MRHLLCNMAARRQNVAVILKRRNTIHIYEMLKKQNEMANANNTKYHMLCMICYRNKGYLSYLLLYGRKKQICANLSYDILESFLFGISATKSIFGALFMNKVILTDWFISPFCWNMLKYNKPSSKKIIWYLGKK